MRSDKMKKGIEKAPHRSFLKAVGLTDEEINKIKDWVDSGMPQGNLADEPSLPEFPEGSQIGKPDLVLLQTTRKR